MGSVFTVVNTIILRESIAYMLAGDGKQLRYFWFSCLIIVRTTSFVTHGLDRKILLLSLTHSCHALQFIGPYGPMTLKFM